jgi:hypothetical protein
MTAYAAGTGELFAHWPDLAPVLLNALAEWT